MNSSQSWTRTATTAVVAILAFGVGGVSALAAGAFGGAAAAPVARGAAARVSHAAASAPQPEVITFQAGRRRLVVQGFAAWSLKLPPGLYQATFKAGVAACPSDPAIPCASGAPDDDSMVGLACGLADLNTIGPATHVFTAESTLATSNGFPAFLSGAETIHLRRGATLGLVCASLSGDRFRMLSPARASFNRVASREMRAAMRATVTIPRDGIRFDG